MVVIRSTVLPGTLGARHPNPGTGERKGGRVDFGVCNNPEFLREGTAIADFHNPPKTVIGATDSVPTPSQALRRHARTAYPLLHRDSEMVKYADNAWHATKVAFANEVGNLCKTLGIDSHAVMDIFCQDTKLNLSPYYLKPGFAFGGSCLPKDLRALTYHARTLDVDAAAELLMLSNGNRSSAASRSANRAASKIGLLGFSFKAGTDDLRESPLVEVIERLIGKGYDMRIYDRNVNLAKLAGANREYLLKSMPHIERLMVASIDEVLAHADVIVIGNRGEEFAGLAARLRPEQLVIDFVRIRQSRSTMPTTPASAGRRVLIIVQNLPVPFDRRVWQEATARNATAMRCR